MKLIRLNHVLTANPGGKQLLRFGTLINLIFIKKLTQCCVVIIMTKANSGIERIAIITDHENNPQGSLVAKPWISIVEAMKITKKSTLKMYAETGRIPFASRIQDTSQEKAIR